jgi:hypothetical protein
MVVVLLHRRQLHRRQLQPEAMASNAMSRRELDGRSELSTAHSQQLLVHELGSLSFYMLALSHISLLSFSVLCCCTRFAAGNKDIGRTRLI